MNIDLLGICQRKKRKRGREVLEHVVSSLCLFVVVFFRGRIAH